METRSKSYIAWIAWRNLIVRTRKNGLSFMTIVSIFGVAIGVAALIIVLSVMGGFENDLKNKMLRGTPHLEILAENASAGFSLKTFPLAQFEDVVEGVVKLEPFTQADVVLKQKKHLSSATLFGIDPDREGHLWGFGSSMTEGETSAVGRTHPSATSWDVEVRRPGIILGEDLAIQLGADIGDEINVLSPQMTVDSALSGGTTTRQFVVAGKFRTDIFNYDAKWAVVSLEEGRKFMPDYDTSLDEEEYVTGVAINIEDPFEIGKHEQAFLHAQKDSSKRFAGLTPLTWQKVNKSLLFALKLEKFAMGSILMLIVLVAAFSISGTMMMTVFHKRGQVSLLRSLGMSRKDIARLYLTHGFTIGTVGIGLGFLLGLAACGLLKSFAFIPLPEGVYHLRSLPVKLLWWDYGIICALAWVFSLVASTYPAITAARQDPGIGLRYL